MEKNFLHGGGQGPPPPPVSATVRFFFGGGWGVCLLFNKKQWHVALLYLSEHVAWLEIALARRTMFSEIYYRLVHSVSLMPGGLWLSTAPVVSSAPLGSSVPCLSSAPVLSSVPCLSSAQRVSSSADPGFRQGGGGGPPCIDQSRSWVALQLWVALHVWVPLE